MALVYPEYQHLLTDSGAINLAGHAALRARPILDSVAFVFDEGDVTVGDVRANGGSPLNFSTNGATDYHGATDAAATGEILQTVLTTIVAGGVNCLADKLNFPAIAAEPAAADWDKLLIYDATTNTDETTRIAVCVVELVDITPNGSGIDVSFDSLDPGSFMTSRT